jgi:tetraacyldisaccharide 4'-kinase
MRRAPRFWWQKSGFYALALAPLSWLYGFISAARMQREGQKASVPVICIGNFLIGGAGKTPTAIWLATVLESAGKRPVFLSRGYGGRLKGPLRVDPSYQGTDEIGDEALLLAKVAPTVVSRDRFAGAGIAASFGNVVIIDDGLQNPSLAKDFSLVVVDSVQGVGNGWCLPSGPLRAPLGVQWSSVDACLIIGDDQEVAMDFTQSVPVPLFWGRLTPDLLHVEAFRGLKTLAFAGIGRPEKFFATLENCGASVVETRSFPDHHRYTKPEITELLISAKELMLVPVTTAKDAVKIREIAPEAMQAIRILDIELTVEDAGSLIAQMLKKIS